MSDLRSSTINFQPRKRLYNDTKKSTAEKNVIKSALSAKIATITSKYLNDELRKQGVHGYQNIINDINTLKDNVIAHGAHENNESNFEGAVYQLANQLSTLPEIAINAFLRTHLPQLLQKLNISTLTEFNTGDNQEISAFTAQLKNSINALQEHKMQPRTMETTPPLSVAAKYAQAAPATAMYDVPEPPGPVLNATAVSGVNTDLKDPDVKEQQQKIITRIIQELNKYNKTVSIYGALQRVKDSLYYSYSYNENTKLPNLIIAPDISNDDFNAIVSYFAATNPDLISKLKNIHALGKSSSMSLLEAVINLIKTEQGELQNTEITAVKKLTTDKLALDKIHEDLKAKGQKDDIVNLPEGTKVPKEVTDTAQKQQQHDIILKYKDSYNIANSKLVEFKEITALLISLEDQIQKGTKEDIIKKFDINNRFTELQKQLLQEQGININSIEKDPLVVINRIKTIVSAFTDRANNAITSLNNTKELDAKVISSTIESILTSAQNKIVEKLLAHDSTVDDLLKIKISRYNKILAILNFNKAEQDKATQYGGINKQLPLTTNDIEFLVSLNGGKQEDILKNLTQLGNYKEFTEALKVASEIKNILEFDYELAYSARIQQYSNLTEVQTELKKYGFEKDINQINNTTKTEYIEKIKIETEVLEKTQKLLSEITEKQKLASFLATLTGAKERNEAFNLNLLDSETLFLLRKNGIVSEDNYFTNAALTGGKTDLELIKQTEQHLQKDASFKPGEIKFTVDNYQQLIDKIKPVVTQIQATESKDISALTDKTKKAVLNNLISILTIKNNILAKSTNNLSDTINDSLEATGEITHKLNQVANTKTEDGAFHEFAKDKLKKPQPIKVNIDADLNNRLQNGLFKEQAKQLQTPHNKTELEAVKAALTSYKDGLLSQQNRYFYSASKAKEEIANLQGKLPKATQEKKPDTRSDALKLYTHSDYKQNQGDYVVYADHKEDLNNTQKTDDFISYLNQLKSNLIGSNTKHVKINSNYLTPKIVFLLSTIGGFKPGNNFFESVNPKDIPPELKNINWTDFHLLAYNQINASSKIPLTVKKQTRDQLNNLIKAAYTIKDQLVSNSLAAAKNIKNSDILTDALKAQMFQVENNVNKNQDARNEVIKTIHHLQKIIWKIAGKTSQEDDDSKNPFSEAAIADKLGVKLKLDLLSKDDIAWLISKNIDPKIIKKAIETGKLSDVQALKQKIIGLWDKIQSYQQELKAAITDEKDNNYDKIIQLVNEKHLTDRGIIIKLDFTDKYDPAHQKADEKTMEPYIRAYKYDQMVFKLNIFDTWLTNNIYKKNDKDLVKFYPYELSIDLIKDLAFKNTSTDKDSLIKKSVLEKAGFAPNVIRFLQEPKNMADGSKVNPALVPDPAKEKGLHRDFYFLTVNKLMTDDKKRFTLIGAEWKVSDLKKLSTAIQETVKQLRTLEGEYIVALDKAGADLLEPSLRHKSLVLEYQYYVAKLNIYVNQIDQLNNEKSAFAEMILEVKKVYDEYELYKKRPYGDFVEPTNISEGMAQIIIKVLELNKKYLEEHKITGLPTTPEQIVKLNEQPEKDKLLSSLYTAVNSLTNKNLKDMKNLIGDQNKSIEKISKISEKLRDLGYLEYSYGAVSLTGGQFAVTVFRQQHANASASREKINALANKYMDDNKLFNQFHQIANDVLPLYFKSAEVTEDTIKTTPQQIPVDKIMLLKKPKIADILHNYVTTVSKTTVAKGQTTKILPAGKNLFVTETQYKLKDGKPLNEKIQVAITEKIKTDGNADYSLLAYNLDHPDNPIVLTSEKFTLVEMQAIVGSLGVIEKTLSDQSQLQLANLQQTELQMNNATEVQIQFIKSYNKACLRLLAAMN